MEEMEEAMGAPKHLTNNIVKGKRTKRQRPQSPIPFSIPTPSISTEENEEDDDDQDIYNPSSSEFDEEEEEMANCLILLAQGHYPPKIEDHKRQYVSKRYTSKRFVESDGKEGVYVYQCKTCDRSFPSFQALGGHRASHKKPKGGLVVEEKKIQRQLSFLSSDCEEDESVGGVEKKPKVRTASTNSLVQLQLLSGSYSKSSPKVHECGICGAEFASGQALGGHMRRHRVAVGTNVYTNSSANASHGHVPTSTSLTLVSGFDLEMDKELTEMKKSKNLLSLDLDLNLPAPADEEKQQQKHKQQQQQQQSQNQSGLVLSTATLVDCHY